MRIIAVIWTASLLTALPLIFVTQTVSPSPGVRYCTEVWPKPELYSAYWILIFAIQYVIPLAAIAVLSAITSAKVRANVRPVIGESFETEMAQEATRRRAQQARRITKMLAALVLLYAVCMLPQHVVFTFWLTHGDLGEKSFKDYVFVLANIFPIANSALNPLAYGTLNKEFKGVFKNVLGWLCVKGERLLCKRCTKTSGEESAATNETGVQDDGA